MDRFIAAMPAEPDSDLMLCQEHGVAYQADRSNLCAYDDAYYSKCASYDGQQIADKINAGRIAFVEKHFGLGRVVDIGIGSGEFIRKRNAAASSPNTFGHDVNPAGIEWLKRNDLWANQIDRFGAVTMWDVIEHLDTPEEYLGQIHLTGFLFVSLPLVHGLGAVRASKHYRPGEHLQYFTEDGFAGWMERHGFRTLEMQTFEIDAGRESIYSFALRRYRWPR